MAHDGGMRSAGRAGTRAGVAAGLMIAGAVVVLALPSAVLAFTTRLETERSQRAEPTPINPFGVDGAGPRLARGFPLQSLARGQLYPFTPAKNPNRPNRSVTVAVRLDSQAITVEGDKSAAGDDGGTTLRLAQTAFNLGVARGYHNFAQDVVPPAATRKGDPPDLSRYSIAPDTAHGEPRFSPRIVIDEKQPPGRAPRTFAGEREDQVDLGGSYRVTRNLNVTAGVRYSQDRERLLPLTDGNQDNQAVYVGTQFRF